MQFMTVLSIIYTVHMEWYKCSKTLHYFRKNMFSSQCNTIDILAEMPYDDLSTLQITASLKF